jgi:hypothetical protein
MLVASPFRIYIFDDDHVRDWTPVITELGRLLPDVQVCACTIDEMDRHLERFRGDPVTTEYSLARAELGADVYIPDSRNDTGTHKRLDGGILAVTLNREFPTALFLLTSVWIDTHGRPVEGARELTASLANQRFYNELLSKGGPMTWSAHANDESLDVPSLHQYLPPEIVTVIERAGARCLMPFEGDCLHVLPFPIAAINEEATCPLVPFYQGRTSPGLNPAAAPLSPSWQEQIRGVVRYFRATGWSVEQIGFPRQDKAHAYSLVFAVRGRSYPRRVTEAGATRLAAQLRSQAATVQFVQPPFPGWFSLRASFRDGGFASPSDYVPRAIKDMQQNEEDHGVANLSNLVEAPRSEHDLCFAMSTRSGGHFEFRRFPPMLMHFPVDPRQTNDDEVNPATGAKPSDLSSWPLWRACRLLAQQGNVQ